MTELLLPYFGGICYRYGFEQAIADGSALARFRELVAAQGGDVGGGIGHDHRIAMCGAILGLVAAAVLGAVGISLVAALLAVLLAFTLALARIADRGHRMTIDVPDSAMFAMPRVIAWRIHQVA